MAYNCNFRAVTPATLAFQRVFWGHFESKAILLAGPATPLYNKEEKLQKFFTFT